MATRLLICTGLILLLAVTANSTVRRVPAEYATIQMAIDAAVNTDTVLVAQGTYTENIVFRGKRIVVTSRFVETGDPSFIRSTIINGGSPAFADSGSCVRIVNGEDSTAIVQGFTLTGGYGTLWQDEHGPGRYWEGGGVFIALSSPTIRFNIIRNNNVNRPGGASTGGGGIRLGDGSPRIINNLILSNAGMYGGGIVSNYASPIIRNNVIAYNVVSQAIAGTPTFGGGGLWFNGAVAGNRVENNTVVGNSSAGTVNSGANGRGGGMIAVFGATLNARNTIVWGNTQTTGSQIGAVSATALVTYSDVEGGFTGQGNINQPPLFADTSFYLQALSPCVDMGDSAGVFNDPADTGNPSLARWPAQGSLRNDMGAYGGPLSNVVGSILTSVAGERVRELATDVHLLPNYPNPFNPSTRIAYSIRTTQYITLKVYDLLGKEVATLVNGVQQAGIHYALFGGESLAGGIYVTRLFSHAGVESGKMMLLK
jgi:hypothetical protein